MKTTYCEEAHILKPGGFPVIAAPPMFIIGWRNRTTGKMRYGRHHERDNFDVIMRNDYRHAPAYPVLLGKTRFKPLLRCKVAMPRTSEFEDGLPHAQAVVMFLQEKLSDAGFSVGIHKGHISPSDPARPIYRQLHQLGLTATFYQVAQVGRDYDAEWLRS